MGHFYGSEVHRSDLRLLIALFRAMLPLTVGGNITWLEPPPSETVTDSTSISRTTKQVIQGSLNEELSCNCSLTADSSIAGVLMKFRGLPAVSLRPNKSPWVEQVFAEHFDAVWVPNKLTLTFFNVTDADEGEYSCEVVTIGRSARTWIRKIQLLVLDPSPAMVSSITVPQNLIQTTVSAITASEDPRQSMASFSSSSQSPIPTTESAITASEVDVPWGIIGAVLGVADAIAIAFAITIICFLKRRKHSQKIHRDDQQENEEVDIVQDDCALLRPQSADGINGNQSKRDIQGKEEDTSV